MDSQIRLRMNQQQLFANGMAFGHAGQYELLSGQAHFAVDPTDASFAGIVDIEHAPRNANGLAEYAADVHILKPVDLERGNRRLLYDVNNRGNVRALQFFNDAVHSNRPTNEEHAGNGFLLRRGYTLVWSGWQGDLLAGDGRAAMQLPVAGTTEQQITGPVRMEYVADSPGQICIPLSANDYTASYEAVSLDTSTATLTCRKYEQDPRRPIATGEWQFARLDSDGTPLPSAFHCYLPAGFRPGWIYELVYLARNPLVLGLGFTGVRDLVSFLKYSDTDSDGAANPLASNGTRIEKAYAWGRSQSGRFLREFVYRGFNEDGDGRRVFDAVWPHVSGGGRVALNIRFAQPGRFPRQHADHLYPSDQFPFSYATSTDPLTGNTDAILRRPATDPLVMHTQTSSEYWERRGSLVHTDVDGNDLKQPEDVRVYLFSSSQHNADPLGGSEPDYRYPTNPLNTTPLLRALLDALDRWATDGALPPESQVPRRDDGTLVAARDVQRAFPSLPEVQHPAEASRLHPQDFGPDFDSGIVSIEPPTVDLSREYVVLVPQVDADGNEQAGLRIPDVEVPLATYTGWNYRQAGSAGQALAGVTGSYFPFVETVEERLASGDPRLSIEERYPSPEAYIRAVSEAARQLEADRLLLEEDVEAYISKVAETQSGI